MNEARLPQDVRAAYLLIGRRGHRMRNPSIAKLTKGGWQRYKLLLRLGVGPDVAFQGALAVK